METGLRLDEFDDWVRQRIVWIAGEDLEALQHRAEELLPMVPAEIRAALVDAVDGGPLSEGESAFWAPASAAELFPAMIRLGLGDESTKGQRLTRLGSAVRELAMSE